MEVHISREMAITLTEFLRILPAALGHDRFVMRRRECHIEYGDGRVLIRLGTTDERRIGSVALPVTTVEFCFEGVDDPSRSVFMERFDRYFQRGGG